MADQGYWENPTLTFRQKRQNWWYYHKTHVLIGAVAAAALFTVIRGYVTKVEPDCTVALVTRYLPTDGEVASLEAQLARYSPDTNGDGKVYVAVNVIQIDYTSTDMSTESLKIMEANIDKLNFDFYTRQSGIFLLEDPSYFQSNHQALAYLDGSIPPEGSTDWENMVRPWEDWPGSALVEREGRLPQALWFGRRIAAGEKDEAAFAGARALWEALFL